MKALRAILAAILIVFVVVGMKPTVEVAAADSNLYWTDQEMAEFRIMAEFEPQSTILANMIAWADANLDTNPPGSLDAAWSNNHVQPVRRYIETMSFLYAFTGDTTYADAAVRYLNLIVPWGTSWQAHWQADCHMLLAVGMAYDVLHDYMPPTLLQDLRTRMVNTSNYLMNRYGPDYTYFPDVLPGSNVRAMYPNHTGTLTAIGVAALALENDISSGQYQDMLDYAIGQAIDPLGALDWLGIDGGAFEGPSYGAFTHEALIAFIDVLKRVKGQDLLALSDKDGVNFDQKMSQLPYFLLWTNYDNGTIGMEDCTDSSAWVRDDPPQVAIMYWLAKRYGNGYMQTMANAVSQIPGGNNARADDIFQSFIWNGQNQNGLVSLPLAELPKVRWFRGIGYVGYRSDWTDTGTLLIVKSGGSVGHQHANQNTFNLWNNGLQISGDAGYQLTRPDQSWTGRQNSILVDGMGQTKEPDDIQRGSPMGTRGVIRNVIETSDSVYILADAAPVYNGTNQGGAEFERAGDLDKFDRHFVIVKDGIIPNYFVNFDDIVAPEAHQYQWLMKGVSGGTIDISGDTITSNRNGPQLTAVILEPEAIDTQVITWSGQSSGARLLAEVQNSNATAQENFLVTMFPSGVDMAQVVVDKFVGSNSIGAVVHTDAEHRDLILFSTDGAPVNETIDLGAGFAPVTVSFDTYTVVRVAGTGYNQPPSLASVGDKSVNETETLQFTVSATDPESDPLTYSASNLPPGASFNAGSRTFSWTPAVGQQGDYPDVHFEVTDGEFIDYENITITVDDGVNVAPIMYAIGSRNIDEGSTLQFTVSATDADGDTLTYSASNLPTGASFSQVKRVFSWTPSFSQSGSYPSVHFEVSDGVLTDSEDITISVNDVAPPELSVSFNEPPTPQDGIITGNTDLTISADVTGAGDVSAFIDWNASLTGYWDLNGDTTDQSTYGNDAATGGALYTAGRFGSALEYNTGDYLKINDSASMDFDKSQGTIEFWLYPNNKASGNYQALVMDSSNWEGPSHGIELALQPNGNLYFYPSDGGGENYNLVVDPLSDNQWQHVAVTWDYSTREALIYVNGIQQNPAVENVPVAWTTVAQTADWFVGGIDQAGDWVSFDGSIDEVRIWNRPLSQEEIMASYDASLNSLSGTFTGLTEGTYSYYVTAVDATGNSARTGTRTVTVGTGSPNQAPVLSTIGNKSVNEGETLTFTISATDADGDPLAYSVSGLVSGAVFDTGSGAFTWTPRYDEAGVYVVHFEVTDGAMAVFEDINITVIQEYNDWDVNGDNVTDILDLTLIGQRWEQSGASGWIREDVNEDGIVNVLDLILIGQHWGE